MTFTTVIDVLFIPNWWCALRGQVNLPVAKFVKKQTTAMAIPVCKSILWRTRSSRFGQLTGVSIRGTPNHSSLNRPEHSWSSRPGEILNYQNWRPQIPSKEAMQETTASSCLRIPSSSHPDARLQLTVVWYHLNYYMHYHTASLIHYSTQAEIMIRDMHVWNRHLCSCMTCMHIV